MKSLIIALGLLFPTFCFADCGENVQVDWELQTEFLKCSTKDGEPGYRSREVELFTCQGSEDRNYQDFDYGPWSYCVRD